MEAFGGALGAMGAITAASQLHSLSFSTRHNTEYYRRATLKEHSVQRLSALFDKGLVSPSTHKEFSGCISWVNDANGLYDDALHEYKAIRAMRVMSKLKAKKVVRRRKRIVQRATRDLYDLCNDIEYDAFQISCQADHLLPVPAGHLVTASEEVREELLLGTAVDVHATNNTPSPSTQSLPSTNTNPDAPNASSSLPAISPSLPSHGASISVQLTTIQWLNLNAPHGKSTNNGIPPAVLSHMLEQIRSVQSAFPSFFPAPGGPQTS